MGIHLKTLIFLYCISLSFSVAYAETKSFNCGKIYGDQRTGVDDYTDPKFWGRPKGERHHLYLVESAHFSKALNKYRSKQILQGGDVKFVLANLDYTLRHFPNHHQALYYVFELERQQDGKLPQDVGQDKLSFTRSSDCYFDRAIRFKPSDEVVYMVYGIHNHKLKNYNRAFELYKKSEELNPDSIELSYNLGLLLLDMGKYAEAKLYAEKAYSHGYAFQGLKNKLAKAGHWP